MRIAVDSNILFDLLKGSADATASGAALERCLTRGSLCACAVVVAELGRYIKVEQQLLNFLASCQIEYDVINLESALKAAKLMSDYADNGGPRSRIQPDFLIGAHALMQANGLLTRDTGFFRDYFKPLQIITP